MKSYIALSKKWIEGSSGAFYKESKLKMVKAEMDKYLKELGVS